MAARSDPHHAGGLRILTGDARDQLAAVEDPEPLDRGELHDPLA